jgi:hypothetical protein
MKKMPYDPILTEMHAIKDAISAEFNHDLGALFAHLREMQAKAVAEGRPVIKAPAKAITPVARKPAKKRLRAGKKVPA